MSNKIIPTWKWTVEEAIEKNKQLTLDEIQHIQNWIKHEDFLPKVSDQQVAMFLNACNYKMDDTKRAIEKCYIMRSTINEFFANRDINHHYVQHALTVGLYALFPGRDNDGNCVLIMKLKDTDSNNYYPKIHMKIIYMIMDAVQLEYGPVPGYVLVIDAKGYTLSHLLRTSLPLVNKFVTYAQDASTFFPKAIYILNANRVVDKAISFIRPFMKTELFSLIKFIKQGKEATLQDQIPIQVLPNEYGGTAGSIINIENDFIKMVAGYNDWFKEEAKLRIDFQKQRNVTKLNNDEIKKNTFTKEQEHPPSLKNLAID